MYIYVCGYVGVQLCIYVYMSTFMCGYMGIYISVYGYMNMCMCIYKCYRSTYRCR